MRQSKGAYIHVSATLHYNGKYMDEFKFASNNTWFAATPFQVHVSAAKAAVDASKLRINMLLCVTYSDMKHLPCWLWKRGLT